jgi:hypothetical protein
VQHLPVVDAGSADAQPGAAVVRGLDLDTAVDARAG